MSKPDENDITALLIAWSHGDASVLEPLMERVYERLHRLAGRFMNQERDEHTLQKTELVHEAYLRLVHQDRVQWRDQAHFFAIAGHAMRRILVDHARRLGNVKSSAAAMPRNYLSTHSPACRRNGRPSSWRSTTH